jgi:hypothetical protein
MVELIDVFVLEGFKNGGKMINIIKIFIDLLE